MENPTCVIDECSNPVRYKSRRWCNAHYLRWRRNGDPLVTRKRPPGVPAPPCSVDGCNDDVTSVGMCHRHRQSLRRNGTPLPRGERSPLQRLEAVGWEVTDDGCWEWSGPKSQHGYGRIVINRKIWITSRLMLLIHKPAPDGGSVCRHKCDNPPCMNPDHLEWGTFMENMDDMVARKREQSYRSGYWGGKCKSGLHDVTIPGAIIEPPEGNPRVGRRCAECAKRPRPHEDINADID